MSDLPEERIESAAIWWKGRCYHLPRPARHSDVIHLMSRMGLGAEATIHQGFRTSADRFVDRKKGLEIARKAGQIVEKHGNPKMLFSEDLW